MPGKIIEKLLSPMLLAVLLPLAAAGESNIDDYADGLSPSAAAKAYFAAVPKDLKKVRILRGEPQRTEEGCAYFTENGDIAIPPGAMIKFRNAGKCMDPKLPAPHTGEPMQFVDTSRLVPRKLQKLYANLLSMMAAKDPRVMSANPQHLVWAIRTAGTESPYADNLSEKQLEVLDECAGRRGVFLKYHEKTKAKNAKKKRKGRGASRITVGNLSYDASELSGTNGLRRIETHISTLTEMGEKATERSSAEFRYGEIEEELYSDIVCDGGLSFSARLLNASDRVKYFRAEDFSAQVGDGAVYGSRRQRVTMTIPNEFVVIKGAAQEGVEISQDISVAEVDDSIRRRVRGRGYTRRSPKSSRKSVRTERTSERKSKTQTDVTTTVTEIPPAPPVPPVKPIIDDDTNKVVIAVTEEVSVRVTALEYDSEKRQGVATIEIISGSFKKANKYIRDKFDSLIRRSGKEDVSKLPTKSKLEIESVSINAEDRLEIRFTVK